MNKVFCCNCTKLTRPNPFESRQDWMYYKNGHILLDGELGCAHNTEKLSTPSPVYEGKYDRKIVERPEELNKNNDCEFFEQKEIPFPFWSRLKKYFKFKLGL